MVKENVVNTKEAGLHWVHVLREPMRPEAGAESARDNAGTLLLSRGK